MKRRLILSAMVLAVLTTGVQAGEEPKTSLKDAQELKTGLKDGKPYFEAKSDITRQAAVIAIDAATRGVKLAAEKDTTEVVCGPEVKNFAQIKVGDVVKVRYTEHLTMHIEPAGGTAQMTTESSSGAAKQGAKPAASATERTEYKATIQAIDKAHGTATLKGYDGEEFVVTPLHPENLDKVTVGELAVFTYTEVMAVSVDKVEAKKTTKK